MAKFSSSSALFLVSGYDFLAAKVQSIALKVTSLTEQADGLGDLSQLFLPVGKQQAMLTQTGAFFDTAAKSIHDAMASKLGSTPSDTPRVMCLGIMGNTVGAVCYGIAGAFSVAYEAALVLSKLTKANAEHLMAGLVERGQIVLPLTVETANFDTTGTPVDYTQDLSQYAIPITSNTLANPTVVTTPVPHGLTSGQIILISGVSTSSPTINGERTVTVISPTTFSVPVNVTTPGTGGSFVKSSTVNGASGYQQVTSFSGFTGYVGKLRHSADNVTYVDLTVFSNVTTGQKAERITAAGTVNRYVTYTGTVTGAGSLTVFSMVARG
jgi:hypothetical protein